MVPVFQSEALRPSVSSDFPEVTVHVNGRARKSHPSWPAPGSTPFAIPRDARSALAPCTRPGEDSGGTSKRQFHKQFSYHLNQSELGFPLSLAKVFPTDQMRADV